MTSEPWPALAELRRFVEAHPQLWHAWGDPVDPTVMRGAAVKAHPQLLAEVTTEVLAAQESGLAGGRVEPDPQFAGLIVHLDTDAGPVRVVVTGSTALDVDTYRIVEDMFDPSRLAAPVAVVVPEGLSVDQERVYRALRRSGVPREAVTDLMPAVLADPLRDAP